MNHRTNILDLLWWFVNMFPFIHNGSTWGIDMDWWGWMGKCRSMSLWSLGIVAIVAASKVILIPYTFYVHLGLRRDVFSSQVDPSGQRGTSFQRSRNVMTVNGALNWNMVGSLKYMTLGSEIFRMHLFLPFWSFGSAMAEFMNGFCSVQPDCQRRHAPRDHRFIWEWWVSILGLLPFRYS